MAYFHVGGSYLLISFVCFYISKYTINHPCWLFYSLWAGTVQLILALSYLYNRSVALMMIHKNPKTGQLSYLSLILCFPYLIVYYFIWYIRQKLSNEPAYSEVYPNIFIGRYPFFYPKKFPSNVDVVVDITTEFPIPKKLFNSCDYYCIPTLDMTMPSAKDLCDLIEKLDKYPQDTKIYIHCAYGHGRSVLTGILFMMKRKIVKTIDEGYRMIKDIRPKIVFNENQVSILKEAIELCSLDKN